MATLTSTIYENVTKSYSFRANNEASAGLRARISQALGYDPIDVASVPDEANIGESCGNPLLIAKLAEGETVVDLGCGGGFDVLLASKKVGASGKAIGVDMTEKMITLARRNADKSGATNTEFFHSKINDIPLESASVDCVISNCVFNLVPDEDKEAVVKEIQRILKPGGRMAMSDFLARKPIPQDMKNDPELFAGCVSGAIEAPLLEQYLKSSGFSDILIIDNKKDLTLYKDGETNPTSVTPCCAGSDTGSCGASGRKEVDIDLDEWIGSFQVYALKTTISSEKPVEPSKKSGGCCCKSDGGC